MTVAAYVSEIMAELGKEGFEIASQIEAKVKTVVVELLSQNDGRFGRLERPYSFTLLAGETRKKLPADFNTQSAKFIETDSAGKRKAELVCMPEADFYRRRTDVEPNSPELTYITNDEDGEEGKGYYLNFSQSSDTDRYIKFFYYRIPTEHDADIIRNTSIVKRGVRGSMPTLFPEWQTDAAAYNAQMQYFKEATPETLANDFTMEPPSHIKRHNRFMHRIGRGQ